MIELGILPRREAWPDGLLEHLQGFRQGDVIAGFPGLYLGDPDIAAHAQTAAYAGSGPGVIEFEPFPYGLILTQTCDLREENSRRPSRPWVHVAPIYNGEEKLEQPEDLRGRSLLGSNIREMLLKGGGPLYLLHLNDFQPEPGLWVADLRLVVPVDKGWLAGKDPIRAFDSEEGRRGVGYRVAMLQMRPAFDEQFESAVRRPLVKALRALGTESDLCREIYAQVHQFAVRSNDNVAMSQAEVWILSLEPLSESVREWFDEQNAEWQANAAETDLNLLPTQFSELRSLTAEEYLSLTTMPLAYLSPDPPWYGAGTSLGLE